MKPKYTKPKPGQESVWDYPRPPKVEVFSENIRIELEGESIVNTNRAKRVLETSHPPVYYIPFEEIKEGILIKVDRQSFCEFKGMAHYFHLKLGTRKENFAAWGYAQPNSRFEIITNHVAFYAHKVDACFVNDEKVQAQEGDFYGGWITSNIIGPFKGGTGTWGW